ncbi:MAG: NADH-quinone oxidoreductase subunit M, partial [Arachnia propionica]
MWAAYLALSGVDLSEKLVWFRSLGAYYALDLDGMSLVMVALTAALTPTVLVAEWYVTSQRGSEGAKWSTKTFFALVLALESLSLFVFLAADVLLFYLFFEATLIPMYFLIAGWGGPDRAKAAMKFLIYSLAGGLIMLVAVAGLYAVSADAGDPSYLVSDLAALNISGTTGQWLFVGFFIAFAIKAPMVPVHTWLPDTAQQATPGASTMLVGILDKIGTFGMVRFCLGIFPDASKWATPVVLGLALLSIIWGGLMAIGSKNLLRLIAYTSVSHFGFMVFGIFAMTSVSMNGSIFYMVNHGFSTAALFLGVGFIIIRRGSAEITDFGGVQKVAPVLAGMFLVSGLSGLALPGMGSFVSEFMVMSGSWQRYPWLTAVATLGTVLAALYILLMYKRTMTGTAPKQVAERF